MYTVYIYTYIYIYPQTLVGQSFGDSVVDHKSIATTNHSSPIVSSQGQSDGKGTKLEDAMRTELQDCFFACEIIKYLPTYDTHVCIYIYTYIYIYTVYIYIYIRTLQSKPRATVL